MSNIDLGDKELIKIEEFKKKESFLRKKKEELELIKAKIENGPE